MSRPMLRRIPVARYEVVAYVGALLRSPECTDRDYAVATALMTRYAIDAEELNR